MNQMSRIKQTGSGDRTGVSVKCLSVMLNLVTILLCCFSCLAFSSIDDSHIFNNQFAVHLPNTTADQVDHIAAKHGFINLGQIGALEGFYLFQHERIHKRAVNPSRIHHENLANEPSIAWVEQQKEKRRIKRDFSLSSPFHPVNNLPLATGNEFPDPFYVEQWYLHGGGQNGFDMNVIPAWRKGYTGKGVVVSILDDGIQTNHPDLAQNYDPLASTDINDNDSDPMPRDNGDNKHGTRCAGEVAAVAFNSFCGVGIAFNASIGGVRMLDGTVNDAVEARALSLNPDHIDIYSASWGPEDDGKTVDGPGPLAKRAFINGIMRGRKGKGSIFVWASGNGGRHEDSCNCDGYTNSIFTLSISSATQAGFKPWYLEECSSTLATTYSSGKPDVDRSIATVDMDGSLRNEFLCTSDHTGTSASAPLAAGICALALEANPNLTWRDMQHLVVFTSRPDPLHDNGWVTNGIGKKVSHKFGYGLMDASAMVTLAEQWTNVPPQHVCQTPPDTIERTIPSGFGQKLEVIVETDACSGTQHEIRFLEHVQCRITLRYAPRGNLRIRLTSPSGTPTVLLFERPRDVLDSTFEDWPFMSVHFWGERAAGRWKLEIINAGNKRVTKPGILKKWQLVFYGTDTNPVRLRSPQLNSGWAKTPTLTNSGAIGRDVHGLTPPLVSPSPAFARKPVTSGQVFFPENAGVPQDFFTSGTIPDFFSFSGSEPVTFRTPFSEKLPMNSSTTRIACPKFIWNNSCVDRCPSGYYGTSQMACEECHTFCTSCVGPGFDHCVACNSSYYKLVDRNICMEVCPDFYYQDHNKRLCIPCQIQCKECSKSPVECNKCEFRFVLHNGQCLAACPVGYYETDDYRCEKCHPTCSTCRGASADHCVTCSDDYVEFNGTCVKQCPSGHWNQETTKQCLPCPSGCESCKYKSNGSGVVCTKCSGDWVLDISSQLCLSPSVNFCPEGQYVNNEKCYPCHGSCSECLGSSSSQCTHCPNDTVLYNGSCKAACPQGTFLESGLEGHHQTQFCHPCPISCTQCDSLERCTECLGGLHLQDGRCLVSCSDGYYSDRGVCVRCHTSCATCSGPLGTDCMRCLTGFSWHQQHCLAQCPVGYFNASMMELVGSLDGNHTGEFDHVCSKCDLSCRTCEKDSMSCTSCAEGYSFNNKTCVPVSSLIEVPLVEFVKEAEGRGARTGKDVAGTEVANQVSLWVLGLGGTLSLVIIAAFVIMVRSQLHRQYSRLSPVYKGENESGTERLLLSSSDIEDDETEISHSNV